MSLTTDDVWLVGGAIAALAALCLVGPPRLGPDADGPPPPRASATASGAAACARMGVPSPAPHPPQRDGDVRAWLDRAPAHLVVRALCPGPVPAELRATALLRIDGDHLLVEATPDDPVALRRWTSAWIADGAPPDAARTLLSARTGLDDPERLGRFVHQVRQLADLVGEDPAAWGCASASVR